MTLEGTVIHKSGLITGGKSTHNNNKKWDEKDIQGTVLFGLQESELTVLACRSDSRERQSPGPETRASEAEAEGQIRRKYYFGDFEARGYDYRGSG